MKRARRTNERPTLPEELDKAVQTIMTDRKVPLPRVNSRIAAILRIAADLRGLPTENFKARLKEELVSRATRERGPAVAARGKVKPIPEGFHSITPYLQVEGAAK